MDHRFDFVQGAQSLFGICNRFAWANANWKGTV